MPNAVISCVRQNSDIVDKLAAELRRHGVTVWLDREQLVPGMRWQQAIRKAIRGGDFFIACFSAESVVRTRTYQNEELVVAIEELRLRPTDRIWFIPVLLSPCEVPDRAIGGGETLNSIQWAALYQNWDEGICCILKAMGVEPVVKQSASVLTEPLSTAKPVPAQPVSIDLITTFLTCKVCGGSGQCRRCYGTGEVAGGILAPSKPCRKCGGSGNCHVCGGSGRILSSYLAPP